MRIDTRVDDMTGLPVLSQDPAHPITETDIAAFERDGVVCLRGMFDRDWCEMLAEAADDVMESGQGRVREAKPENGHGRFYLGDLDARYHLLRDASPAPEIAAFLMHAKRIRIFYDQLFIKSAATAAPTPWQDELLVGPFRGNDLISIWIALMPVSKETSGVQYVAGSHRWETLFRAVTPDYDRRFIDESMDRCPDYGGVAVREGVEVVSWDMEPGDVLCHHPLTVHVAAGSASATQMRIGLSVPFLGDDVQWDPRPHTMALLRDPGVARGDFPTDDVALPIAWEEGIGLVRTNVRP